MSLVRNLFRTGIALLGGHSERYVGCEGLVKKEQWKRGSGTCLGGRNTVTGHKRVYPNRQRAAHPEFR